MWIEADQPAHTFWQQTQRSFAIVIASAAKREIALAWKIAALTASAGVGKLPKLDELLMPSTEAAVAQTRMKNARLLGDLRNLQAKGVSMTIERVERLH